ncbi:MAG TPA: hypothetical protein VGL55_03985 [Steroidobacteraceae bacterium]|jgi:uncharacterized membrane protein YphA (DoxX/SURF4 family)
MRPTGSPQLDIGLLVLRLGIGAALVLLLTLKQAAGGAEFLACFSRAGLATLLIAGTASVAVGVRTRGVAAFMALIWASLLGAELYTGEPLYLFPVRAALFLILFAALALTGAGRFSVDHARVSKAISAVAGNAQPTRR